MKKTIPNIYISSFFLIICSLCFSQNNTIKITKNDSIGYIDFRFLSKYIEVEAHDSIHRKNISGDYIITITEDPDPRYGISLKEYHEKKLKLDNFLKSERYKFKHITFDGDLKNNVPHFPDNYLISIKSMNADVRKFIMDLNNFDFIDIRFLRYKYKNEDKIDGELFKKLIKKAQKKASILAKTANVKLGKIININENTEFYGDLWPYPDYYDQPYSAKSIIVRFSIE